MALTLVGTFTPSGYLTFQTAKNPGVSNTFNGGVAYNPFAVPTGYALPAGSSPATVLIENAGPDACVVLISAAAESPTGTANAGSTALTVSSGTGIVVGQAVVGAGIAPGTTVAAVSGTAVTLSLATTAAVSSTVNFLTVLTLQTGIMIQPGTSPLALDYVSSGFIQALAIAPNGASTVNVAVGV
jgi:hypothetical protein